MAADFDAEAPDYTPEYILGRPLPPDAAMDFAEVEARVACLLELCLRQHAEGGCVIAGANAASESHLYHTLAVLSSRLRRRGYQTEFPCIPFSSRLLPVRSRIPGEISIVLDAPLRRYGDEWTRPRAGSVTILAGFHDHWHQLGIVPAIDCSANHARAAISLERQIARWQTQFLSGSRSEQIALLSAAAGCDLPARTFPDGNTPRIASPVLDLYGEPTGFWSTPGHYLAHTALRRMWSRNEVRRVTAEIAFELTGVLADDPLVLDRFGFGLGGIVNNRTLDSPNDLD